MDPWSLPVPARSSSFGSSVKLEGCTPWWSAARRGQPDLALRHGKAGHGVHHQVDAAALSRKYSAMAVAKKAPRVRISGSRSELATTTTDR